ncbi:MAG TPA: hypothetical protein PLJ35_11475 [Anaerolineae bacterium]|nr:hypothetical protein [Anaerolineae bacterium]HOQ99430.1 hypothetical protein [Anaerolineae bacterium]HPL29387.1 hypothetical protein [Anaerolineae bacterium]
MIPESHWSVLRRLCAQLQGIAWAVTGSVGLALQGVPVDVHDIDIQGSETSVYAIERCFAGHVRQAVHLRASEAIGSHFGVLEIDGVMVELMGGLQKRLPSGAWEPPIDVARLRHLVEARGLRIPVLPLEHEYEAYLIMGRTAKAALIKETIDRQQAGKA